ncbi:pentapeptide repeat-containing protein [Campylobacter mucosalis]|uniref:pentapeptide repeat-containing protein n=1 Tax=Campylobacter mucosalis TaxID=202 RepID=UPI001470549C|nr:pentapeptide repeat-containing protein [Campylobacter mucosalis]
MKSVSQVPLKKSNDFELANKKLKEIFGENNVSNNISVSISGIVETHIIYKVCKIDTINNEYLRKILKEHNIKFQECKINSLFVNDFKNITFEKCKINVFESMMSEGNKKERLEFINCKFTRKFELESTNFKNINFKNCAFKDFYINGAKFATFNFQDCKIFGNFMAKNCIFKNSNFKSNIFYNNTDFSNSIFTNETYFNNSEFRNFTDFHESNFKNIASFYGVYFYKTPNFSSVNFNKNPILINMSFKANSFDDIKIDCDNQAEAIHNKRKNINKNKQTKDDIFNKTYSDFRNSFSILKTTLINSGNVIDSKNHHKAELYCKEMELSYDLHKEKKVNFVKWINYISLKIYRTTSDHHTNLSKIFHFMLLMIASYGIFLPIINNLNNYIINNNIENMLFSFVCFLAIIPICICLKNIKNISDTSIWIIFVLYTLFIIYSLIFQQYSVFGVVVYFTILYIFLVGYTTKSKFISFATGCFTYFVPIFVLFNHPSLINPTLNLFNKENIENNELLKQINSLDYDILSHLTRLSFRDYDINVSSHFSENIIVNQKEIIISNKDVLNDIFKFLVKIDKKDKQYALLQNIDDENKLKTILEDHTNRQVALDLIYAANKEYTRKIYDMEFKDGLRLFLHLATKQEIKNEINLITNILMQNKNEIQKLKTIIDKQEIYFKIYKAITLDTMNTQIYKSTYILYVIIMILCLYSITKTARKNSITT